MKKISIIFSLVLICYFGKSQSCGYNGIELNRAVPDGTVDSVWSGIGLPLGFSGKDVIIGFTDWGFDYSHPVFYDTSLTTYRVLRAWDQFKQNGPAPSGFTYGREYIGQSELLSAPCDTSNVYQYAYHGTHVAGIAGGAGAGTVYRGVAFDANLLFATFLVNEQSVIDAFQWMFNVAQQEQKRLVINMSWGLYYIDNFTGTGRIGQKMEELSDLGVVFVTSAGNNGDLNFHISHNFDTEADTLKTAFTFSSGSTYQYGQSITMTNSVNAPFSFALQVMNSTYQPLLISPFYYTGDSSCNFESYIVVENDTVFYTVEIDQQDPNNGRPEVRLRVKKLSTAYKLGLFVTAETGIFHAWNIIELTNDVGNWGGSFIAPGSLTGWKAGDPHYGLGSPAVVDCAITVAAHKSRVITPNYTIGGEITDFSSYGPTIDGATKPEVSAPGNNVVSSISSYTNQFSGTYTKTISFQGRDYKFAALSGTSMSSPFTAGVVALILQANPYLSPAQVKQILIQSARNDEFTLSSGEERFGYGKVDAYHAVILALQTVGIETIVFSETKISMFPNPSSGSLYITTQADHTIPVQVFDFCGKLIKETILEPGVSFFDWNDLPSGCYIIKVKDQQKTMSYKWIKL
jgi:minor extracellular serine protease Vpr